MQTLMPARDPNIHILGCLDPVAGKDVKRVIYARVPFNATSVRYLCNNCDRFHVWVLDKLVREWKDNS